MIKAFDVSMYEDKIDWPAVAASEFGNFVVVRAGQGTLPESQTVGGKFDKHWAGARAVGIPRSCYWVYDPRYTAGEPQRQAEAWVAAMHGDFGELPLVADIEKYITGPYHGFKFWYDFLEYTKALLPADWKRKWIELGFEPIMIYTGYYYFRDESGLSHLPTIHESYKAYFARHLLWLADYGAQDADLTKPPETRGRLPLFDWTHWTLWQYAEHLVFPELVTNENGSPTSVDTNVFDGSVEDFRRMFGLSETTPPEPPQTGEPMASGLTTGNPTLNLRSGPGVEYGIIGKLSYGTGIEWDKESLALDNMTWCHVTKFASTPVTNGWVSKAYVNVLVPLPPPPVGEPEPVWQSATLTLEGENGKKWWLSGNLTPLP